MDYGVRIVNISHRRYISVDLLPWERKITFDRRKNLQRTDLIANRRNIREKERSRTLAKWQIRCQGDAQDIWNFQLIQRVKNWIESNHGKVNQYLTGHRNFRSYLNNNGNVTSPTCLACENTLDNAEHSLFMC